MPLSNRTRLDHRQDLASQVAPPGSELVGDLFSCETTVRRTMSRSESLVCPAIAITYVFSQIRSAVGATLPISNNVSRMAYLASTSFPDTFLVDFISVLGVLRGDLDFLVGDSILGLTSGSVSRSMDMAAEYGLNRGNGIE